MYSKLIQLIGQYLEVRHSITQDRCCAISGKLIEVTAEYTTLESYDPDSFEYHGIYSFPTSSIINILTDNIEEQRIKAEVSYAKEQEVINHG